MKAPGLGTGSRPSARERAPRWRRAVGADIPALSAFLREGEERRVGFSGRLLREAGFGASASVRLPSPLRGAVWLVDVEDASATAPSASAGPEVAGAVLCHPSRLVFPIFPASSDDREAGISLLASAFSPASVTGMTEDVERYESALGLEPLASVAYRMMAGAERERRPLDATVPGHAELSIRRVSPADLPALLPLQEAYEREEVLTRIHRFNPAACKASLARALERQLVFAAEEGGVMIAKAGTNARGFAVDQIGGVYTLPARRGRGIAFALMATLLSEISYQGRSPALFVKPSNAAARALYRGLGFEDIGDYRADYFEA